jgi:signal transduction histidine kinase
VGAATIEHAEVGARRRPSHRSDAARLGSASWRHGAPGALAALLDWVEHSGEPVVALDPAGRIAIANPAFARVFAIGNEPADDASVPPTLSRFVPLLSPQRLARWVDEGAAGGTRVHRLLAEAIGADGDRFLVAATLLPVAARATDGEPACVVAMRPLDAPRGPRLSCAGISDCRLIEGKADTVAIGALFEAVSREHPSEEGRQRIRRAPHDVAACIAADPEAVRDALGRLADNAIRYAPSDSPVTLRSRRETCEPAGAAQGAAVTGHIVITVADRGRGFTRSQLQRAFEPFARAPSPEAGEGPGLGLAVARHLIEAQGGWIELRSVAGVGTEAEVWLPEAS